MNFNLKKFENKKAIVRVDFNVPLDKITREVTDATRIKAALPTILKILQDGGSVILMSHLGRPKDGFEEKYSLKHIIPTLENLLGQKVTFADDCMQAKEICQAMKSGDVVLLENLRFYKAEEAGNPDFAKVLSSYADYYVNDAFGTAHRAHASTAIIANYFDSDHKCFGFLMESEVANAQKILQSPAKPVCAIIGGAKVSDKILLIENLLNKVDFLLIGGGMAYTFYKAMGAEIGKSLCEDDKLDLARNILEKAERLRVTLLLPEDSICAEKFENDSPQQIFSSRSISPDFMGLDIGEKAQVKYREMILQSKSILWNGPMGVFEMSHFAQGTKAIAEAVADATQQGAFSLIGGGDSVAAINMLHLQDKVSYVSTGGGALLELFEGKVLPGIAAIQQD